MVSFDRCHVRYIVFDSRNDRRNREMTRRGMRKRKEIKIFNLRVADRLTVLYVLAVTSTDVLSKDETHTSTM